MLNNNNNEEKNQRVSERHTHREQVEKKEIDEWKMWRG